MAISRKDLEARAAAAQSVERVKFRVEGLGDVWLRKRLTQAEYLRHLERMAATPKTSDAEQDGFRRLYPSLLVGGALDEDGASLFTGLDDPLFSDFDVPHMVAIGDELLKLWGLEKMAPPDKQLKNSEAAPT